MFIDFVYRVCACKSINHATVMLGVKRSIKHFHVDLWLISSLSGTCRESSLHASRLNRIFVTSFGSVREVQTAASVLFIDFRDDFISLLRMHELVQCWADWKRKFRQSFWGFDGAAVKWNLWRRLMRWSFEFFHTLTAFIELFFPFVETFLIPSTSINFPRQKRTFNPPWKPLKCYL